MSEELFENFESMTEEEINHSIVHYTREILDLEADKKAYVAGIRDAIKDLKGRVSIAISALNSKRAP